MANLKDTAVKAVQGVALWLEERLHITKMWNATAGHAIPKSAASWFYVFGSGTLLCFIIQIVTGICLALVYQPTGADSYQSLEHLTYVTPLGWYLRALHYWGSNFMVAIMFLHMVQVFMFGAFKYPRELNWISGVILMLLTLGMAFSGQVVRWDADAYWGLGIGVAIMGRIPIIGPEVVHWFLGGPIIAGETLSRFFTLHVFVLPGAILALVALHLRLVLTTGINEYPEPGKKVVKETYLKEYDELVHGEGGMPFAPDGIGKDVAFAGFVIGLIAICAFVFGPKGPEALPDPTLIRTAPRPDWAFMWIFAVASLIPDWSETIVLLVAPMIGILVLIALPFYANTGEKSWKARPVSVLVVAVGVVALCVLTWAGIASPWSPPMEAWKADPTPEKLLVGRTPLERQGALVFQNKQCRNCHALEGTGGFRGPLLDDVAARLTPDQMVRQVIQGGGNMPAYGKNLNPAEVEALVAYMKTLKPPNVPAASDMTRPNAPTPGAPAAKPAHTEEEGHKTAGL